MIQIPTSSIYHNVVPENPEDLERLVCAMEESKKMAKRGKRSDMITIDYACNNPEVIKAIIEQKGDELK